VMPWVSRVKIEDVEARLVRAENQLSGLGEKCKRIEQVAYCDHSDTKCMIETSPFSTLYGVRQCVHCGLIVDKYDTEVEFLAAKISHEEAIVSRDARRLRELKK